MPNRVITKKCGMFYCTIFMMCYEMIQSVPYAKTTNSRNPFKIHLYYTVAAFVGGNMLLTMFYLVPDIT